MCTIRHCAAMIISTSVVGHIYLMYSVDVPDISSIVIYYPLKSTCPTPHSTNSRLTSKYSQTASNLASAYHNSTSNITSCMILRPTPQWLTLTNSCGMRATTRRIILIFMMTPRHRNIPLKESTAPYILPSVASSTPLTSTHLKQIKMANLAASKPILQS